MTGGGTDPTAGGTGGIGGISATVGEGMTGALAGGRGLLVSVGLKACH